VTIPQKSYEIVIGWFEKNNISQSCPLCGEEFEIYGIDFVTIQQKNIGPNNLPLKDAVSITCHNCGHIRLFGAVKIGFAYNRPDTK
jgi:predicted RNA-binding Zn-ribbon protein involved in translation (DUF1610 family)